MRHNDARKWLHAGLDLLPLILIPVFMIYSHRHTIDSGSIEVPINKVVDFNQQESNGDFSKGINGWSSYSDFADLTDVDSSLYVSTNDINALYLIVGDGDYDLKQDHIYYFTCEIYSLETRSYYISLYNNFVSYDYINANSSKKISTTGSFSINYSNSLWIGYYDKTQVQIGDSFYLDNVMVIDFTQMFGSGNEPTIQQFETWYSNDYYNYTVSHKELLKDYSTVTYDDTDIMSQFTYQFYNSVDKYFNMGNVFGLSNVYDWFNLNIFSGNAPIAVYIVWQVVLYEFVMDLLFLLYGLFMWFIDMCKHLMEKPFRSIK